MQKSFSWPEKFCFGVFDHMVCLEGGQIGGQSGQKWTFFFKKIQKNLKKNTKIKNISTAYILAFLTQNDPKFGRKKFLNPKFLGISKKSFFKKVDFGLKWKLMDCSFMENFYFCPMTSSCDVIVPKSAENAFRRVSAKNEFF